MPMLLEGMCVTIQSVFPQTELGTFMALNKIDKEKQLRELTNIVTGIRLFNRNCGKGGEGIDDCKFYEQILIIKIFLKICSTINTA